MTQITENADVKPKRSHLWKPGQSGNPKGKPKGTRHRATQIAQALLDNQVQELIQVAVNRALAGDPACLRLLIERILPPRRERQLDLSLPAIEGASSLPMASEAILQAAASGSLTASETATLIGALAAHARLVETAELKERLEAVERTLKIRGGKK